MISYLECQNLRYKVLDLRKYMDGYLHQIKNNLFCFLYETVLNSSATIEVIKEQSGCE